MDFRLCSQAQQPARYGGQSSNRLRTVASASGCLLASVKHSKQTRRPQTQLASRLTAQAVNSLLESAPPTQAQLLLRRSDDVQRMQQYDPLRLLPASHVMALVQTAEQVRMQAGEAVAVAGQAASALLILENGELHAEDASYQGEQGSQHDCCSSLEGHLSNCIP